MKKPYQNITLIKKNIKILIILLSIITEYVSEYCALSRLYCLFLFTLYSVFIWQKKNNFVMNLQIIQIFAIFFILWALLGQSGWDVQTIKGLTLPEYINGLWFRVLNIISAYLFVFAYFYSL